MRRVARALAATLLALACLAGPAPAAAAERVFALGGPSALTDEALRRAGERLGAAPVRLSGPDRFATAVAASRHAHPHGAQLLYVVSAHRHADALAALTAVAARDAALLPVHGDVVPAVVEEEIRRLAPARVYVVGGRDAVPDTVRDRLHALTGAPVRRLDGADRYATAALLARHAHRDGAATVYVASGAGPADGLAAASGVVAHRAPLLLSAADALPAVIADELARLAPARVLLVGGRAALSDAVADRVRQVTGVAPERLAGADRVATSEAVAAEVHPGGAPTVYLAGAHGPADAIAGLGAAAAHDAALLLVDPAPPVSWLPRIDEAAAYARTRAGSVSFAAIGTDSALSGHRADTAVPAASVLKVMFLAAYLRQPSVAEQALTDSDRALLEPMIRRSANEPATHIANQLGPRPLWDLAAAAGMRDFSYTRPWGLSRTSARDEARFLLELDRHLPERHRVYALGLLTEVVPEQRWGIGEVATPGWTAHFKGGWGSGSGAVNHQVVQLRHADGTRIALAVMTTGSPSHGYASETLREVFRRLLANLP